MSGSVIWSGEGLAEMRGAAELARALTSAVEPDPDSAAAAAFAGVPATVLGPLAALGLGFRLAAECHQFSDVLSWGLEGPEAICPMDEVRFSDEVSRLQRLISVAAETLARWAGELGQKADHLDHVARLVADGTAMVEEDEAGNRRILVEKGAP